MLDKYVGAAFAVSTRKLRTNYNGPCVRLRRSTDNAESDFGFGPDGWVNTTAIASWLGAGTGFVVTWYDQSGNFKDVTQATASAQPTWTNSTALMGNRPAMLLSSTALTRLTRTQDVLPTGATPTTLFSVASRDAVDAIKILFSIGTNIAGNRPSLGSTSTATQRARCDYNGSAASTASGAWPFNSAKAIAGRCDNVNNSVMVDGVAGTPVAATSLNVGTIECAIGRIPNGTSYWDGYVAECIAYANVSNDWVNIQANEKVAFSI